METIRNVDDFARYIGADEPIQPAISRRIYKDTAWRMDATTCGTTPTTPRRTRPMLNTETPATEALRLAERYGRDALALIRAPHRKNPDFLTSGEYREGALIYWHARLAAREAARYLKLTEDAS